MDQKQRAEEQEFLQSYDPSQYPRPSVTADIAVFAIFDEKSDNYRKLPQKVLHLLLIKRGGHPYKDCYALPGGFVRPEESLDMAAVRELREETGIDCSFLEQLRTFSTPGRDPRSWIITGSYLALLDGSKYLVRAGDDASDAKWFQVSMEMKEGVWRLKLQSEDETISAVLRDTSSPWDVMPKLEVVENSEIAFDHALIIAHAILQLRKWIRETRIAFRLLPEKFTLTQLQQVHEAVLETRLLTPAFRRKVEEQVEVTEEMVGEEGHRPARVFVERKEEAE